MELSPLERRLVAGVEAGEVVDLAGEAPVDPTAMGGWAADREVRGELIRDILLGRLGATADPRGLRLRGARIVGSLHLDGVRIGMRVALYACDFVEVAWLRGAELAFLNLDGSRLAGLHARELVVERTLLLRNLRVANGRVGLSGARTGGSCDLTGCRLSGTAGPALEADRVRIEGDLLLDGLTAEGAGEEGAVRLVGAHVDGRLSARGVRLTNRSGPALVADNLQVPDTVDFSQGVRAHGAGPTGSVRMVGARVGSISFGRAELANDTGPALALHYADVDGTVYLDGLHARGMVRLSGARIGGRLDGTAARLDGSSDPALDATRVRAEQGVVLRDASLRGGDKSQAAVELRGAQIGGDLDLLGARLGNDRGLALRMSVATVQGALIVPGLAIDAGGINMRGASLAGLHDDPGRLAGHVQLLLDGLTYRGIPGDPTVRVTVQQRIDWLRRMEAYAAQPYRQLAAAYQAAGHEEEARRVLVAQQQHLDDSGLLTGAARLRHRLLGITLGYGYQSWRAVLGLLATIAVAAVLLVAAGSATAGADAGGRPAGRCPTVERVGLAIDATVPLVDTGTSARCAIVTTSATGQTVLVLSWVLRLLGWAFATLVVAGYTGLVRRG